MREWQHCGGCLKLQIRIWPRMNTDLRRKVERFMRRSLLLVGLVLISGQLLAADAARSAPAEPSGMQSLFNGKDLSGWDGDPRLWSVKDGVLRGETTAENPATG